MISLHSWDMQGVMTYYSLGSFLKCLSVCLIQVPAIQQRRIVAYVNQFVVHTVRLLNHFSIVCEEVCTSLWTLYLHLRLWLFHTNNLCNTFIIH